MQRPDNELEPYHSLEEYEDFAPANRNIHFTVTLCVYKICKSLKDVNMVIRESYIAFMAIFSFTA